jgi:hypothetical protein
MLRKYEWENTNIWDIMTRPNLWITAIGGEEIQTKGLDNLFNRIIAEKFSNLEKESPRYRITKPSGSKKKHSRYSIIKHSAHRTKKEFWMLQKRKDKSHIKTNPLE